MGSYIDEQYYTETFRGADAGDDLEKLIQRASDVIDQVTGYKLVGQDVEELPQFIRAQVKKAVAAQVEFYVARGGYEEVDAGAEGFQSVSIGSFRYDTGRSTGQENRNADRVSPAALQYLAPTGLLYTGLEG